MLLKKYRSGRLFSICMPFVNFQNLSISMAGCKHNLYRVIYRLVFAGRMLLTNDCFYRWVMTLPGGMVNWRSPVLIRKRMVGKIFRMLHWGSDSKTKY